MLRQKENKKKRKLGFKAGLFAGFIAMIVISGVCFNYYLLQHPNKIPDITIEEGARFEKTDDGWTVVQTIEMKDGKWLVTGENNPGAGASGWLSMFLLDYGEDPTTVLANNATDWSAAGTAMGYVDADEFSEDIVSEDPFYFVIRCRFNDTAKDAGSWNWSRYRVILTVSGDETLNTNMSKVNCTGVNDANVSAAETNWIFINFYWDDGVDGYRILDDGSITVSAISIQERR